jgi:hypothetical protein
MPKVEVKPLEATQKERALGAFEPMRWAELKASGKPVYIGNLAATQNGNACGCCCPSCGEDLQAVNAGKDASHFARPGTRGMFFRHTSGHQRGDCGFIAVKLAALHLLMEQGEVDLPAPRRRHSHLGVSGQMYWGESEGSRWRGQIQNKVWLDDQSAKITLDDGRVVLVLLRANPEISLDGGIDGVITIEVDDPAVASWGPQQILDRLKLDNGFACWQKHWDDDSLNAAADHAAKDKAEDALDALPQGLFFPDGLTQFQKSETILHAKVKEILAEAGEFHAPGIMLPVRRLMDDGKEAKTTAELNSEYLKLTDVRLEHRLKGLVPDVICQAQWRSNPAKPFALLIEVAVTHRVDEIKKKKIRSAELACVEIDLSWVPARSQRITVGHLKSAVIHGLESKAWIFNPFINKLVQAKSAELERYDLARRAERQVRTDRILWLNMCSEERLLELFLSVLKRSWAGKSGVLRVNEGYLIDADDIAAQLSLRGFANVQEPFLLSQTGLLSHLDELKSSLRGRWFGDRLRSLRRMDHDPEMRRFITLGLMMVSANSTRLAAEEKELYEKLRQTVTQEVRAENRAYLRPKRHDALIARLFPEIREPLKHPFGTMEAFEEKQKVIREKKRLEMMEEAHQQALKEAQKHKVEIERWHAREKIDELLIKEKLTRWVVYHSVTSLEDVLKQRGVQRLVGNYARSNLDVTALLSQALVARDEGTHFRSWFVEVGGSDLTKARMMLEALKLAGLIDK